MSSRALSNCHDGLLTSPLEILDYLKTGNAYQVEILRRDGKYYIHITIEEATPIPYNAKGAMGVDTNPDGPVDSHGRLPGTIPGQPVVR